MSSRLSIDRSIYSGACSEVPAKLVILMDVSNSVSATDCDNSRNFMENLVKRLEIDASCFQVAVVTFTNKVEYYFDFLASEDALLKEISNMGCGNGRKKISKGLEKALELFDRSSGAVYTDSVVLLLSDGNVVGNDVTATRDAVNVSGSSYSAFTYDVDLSVP